MVHQRPTISNISIVHTVFHQVLCSCPSEKRNSCTVNITRTARMVLVYVGVRGCVLVAIPVPALIAHLSDTLSQCDDVKHHRFHTESHRVPPPAD